MSTENQKEMPTAVARYEPMSFRLIVLVSMVFAASMLAQNTSAVSLDALIQQLDTNSDGRVSKTEATGRYAERFAQWDADGDGFASRAEIHTYRLSIGINDDGKPSGSTPTSQRARSTATASVLNEPADWRLENLPMPPGFAPEITLRGREEIRFAPGMFKTDASDYFTCVIAITADEAPNIGAAELKDFLRKYYRGLSGNRARRTGEPLDTSKLVAIVKSVDGQRFEATMDFLDSFNDGRRITLNIEAQTFAKPATKKTVMLLLVSPSAKDSEVWKTLHAIGSKTTAALSTASPEARPRASYYKDGEIHITTLGEPETKAITTWHWDFKPSWSITGDHLVFFRRLKDDPDVNNWITTMCIINTDGTGFHQLSDGTFTDFNPTWTRDGKNTPVWNRKVPGKLSYYIMASKIGGKPGEEVQLTSPSCHSWVHSAVRDGRLFVSSSPPKQKRGYFLMTPNPGGEPEFERVTCELADKGILDRISVSPSETKICFEYQTGFKYEFPGRTLYVADFDMKTRAITNLKPFANAEAKKVWFAYPRFTQGESSIVYHAGSKLFLYSLTDGSTKQVSTDAKADYRYPHGEATPN